MPRGGHRTDPPEGHIETAIAFRRYRSRAARVNGAQKSEVARQPRTLLAPHT
jgi:hypothetical protein